MTTAARGGLKPSPATRLRGAYPHLLCSIAARRVSSSCMPSWHTIIPTISTATHTLFYLQTPKVLTEADTRIVAALVGMKHDSRGPAA